MTVTTEIPQCDGVTRQGAYNRKNDGAILTRPLEGSPSLLPNSCRASRMNLHTVELILIAAKLRIGGRNTRIGITFRWSLATGFEFTPGSGLQFLLQIRCGAFNEGYPRKRIVANTLNPVRRNRLVRFQNLHLPHHFSSCRCVRPIFT